MHNIFFFRRHLNASIYPITSHGYLKIPANATVEKIHNKFMLFLIHSMYDTPPTSDKKNQLIPASHALAIRV